MVDSHTFEEVKKLILAGQFLVSEHGYEEMEEDGIFLDDLLVDLKNATVVEDYPDAWKGPSFLLLSFMPEGKPIHAVWGLPKFNNEVAVLITAYIPSLQKWLPDFMTRKPK